MISLYATVVVADVHARSVRNPFSVENARPPKVGDAGAVVEVLRAPSAATYLVECTASDGATAWLEEFQEDQLRVVDSPSEA